MTLGAVCGGRQRLTKGNIEMENFKKYAQNPVFGSADIGTTFDAYTQYIDGRYRMDFSQRAKKACAVTFSDDGVHWSEPVVTLASDPTTGWEDDINRNCVLRIDGVYKMWYTGQARGHSYIGYAESRDGINFERKCSEPILIPEYPWENASVMNPCVLYENGEYRMWYSAGETYEPNVLAYAVSNDGINWRKSRINPIFVCDRRNRYEQERIGGCQVIRTEDMGYVMFYIGYEDINTARICVAHSDNGITGWERSRLNPIVSPDADAWDADACYKPTAVWNADGGKWMLWYNGRRAKDEYIGLAEFDRRQLF